MGAPSERYVIYSLLWSPADFGSGIDPDTLFNLTRPTTMFKQGESSTTGARRELSADGQWEIKASMEDLGLQLAMQTSLREPTA